MKAIRTKYHGPTNTRGSKITADDGDGNRISLSLGMCDLTTDQAHLAACAKLKEKMGWTGDTIMGWHGGCAYHAFFDAAQLNRDLPQMLEVAAYKIDAIEGLVCGPGIVAALRRLAGISA